MQITLKDTSNNAIIIDGDYAKIYNKKGECLKSVNLAEMYGSNVDASDLRALLSETVSKHIAHTNAIKAKYIGEDEKVFKKGTTHYLKSESCRCTRDSLFGSVFVSGFSVTDVDTGKYAVYTSLETFLCDWEVVK